MQRYSKQSDGKRSSWMATDDDGEYVKYSDHITQLEAALAAATVPAEVVEAVVDKPDGRETVKVTMAYKSNGRITEQVVSGISTERVHPLPADGGWRRNPDYGTNKFTSNLSCGDRILVAVPLSKSSGGGYDIHLIIPTESGFNDADGDYWGTWSWDDVEYYMTLPSPPQAEGGAA